MDAKQRMRTKLEFLSSRRATKSERFNLLFMKAYDREEETGLDLCQFPVEELKALVSELPGTKSSTRSNNLGSLNAYLGWCQAQGIPGATGEIEVDDQRALLERIRSTHVVSPAELDELLGLVFPKEPAQTTRTLYRAFYWMLFSGISRGDTVKVATRNVNLEERYIKLTDGKKYAICEEALPDIRDAVTAQYLRNLCSIPGSDNEWRPRKDGFAILRGFRNDGVVQQFRTAGSKAFQDAYRTGKTKKIPTAQSISYSGTYYKMWVNEQKGWQVDFTEIARIHSEESGRCKGKSCTRNNIIIASKNIENDYRMWKMAFHLE